MSSDILPIEFMARREDWSEGISLYARQATAGHGCAIAQPLEMMNYDNAVAPSPFIRLNIGAAQKLIDELWDCGLRPSEGAGSAGSLAATEKHLKDMRKIAFKKLNIEA